MALCRRRSFSWSSGTFASMLSAVDQGQTQVAPKAASGVIFARSCGFPNAGGQCDCEVLANAEEKFLFAFPDNDS
jgi:Na+-transporting NADH:ubiquinone oxidoreductase subunit NqrF